MKKGRLYQHRFGDAKAVPVLWLHGWLGQGSDGEALQEVLGENVQFICPDLPGHGETPIGSWELSALLRTLAEVAARCEIVMGYSLGGRLLMMAAARYPLAFGSLVIESAHPGLCSEEERMKRKMVDSQRAQDLRDMGLDAFCRQWYQAGMWAGLPPPDREGDPKELAEALQRFGLCHQPDLRPWLRTTRNPLLWLAGTRDRAYVSHADWCRQHTSHQVEVVDTGHNIHDQNPGDWARLIQQFISI